MKLNNIVVVKYKTKVNQRNKFYDGVEIVEKLCCVQGLVDDIVSSSLEGDYIIVNGERIYTSEIVSSKVILE